MFGLVVAMGSYLKDTHAAALDSVPNYTFWKRYVRPKTDAANAFTTEGTDVTKDMRREMRFP